MATHFIAALKIPSLRTMKSDFRKAQNDNDGAMDNANDDEDKNDVDTRMDVEAVGLEATDKDTSPTTF